MKKINFMAKLYRHQEKSLREDREKKIEKLIHLFYRSISPNTEQ